MKRNRAAVEQNLDPLLDTMANVVGILVMLVAVTQLSVGDAVERIKDRGSGRPVTRLELEVAEVERDRVEQALVSARGELEAMVPTERRRGLLIEEVRSVLEDLEALPDRDELRGLSAAALHARLAVESDEVARLERELEGRRRKASGLEALLAAVPAERRPKIARLPDPRPPPAGTSELAFLCRYGRVQAIDVKRMKRLLKFGIEQALGQDRVPVESDKPFMVNHFAKVFVGNDLFQWTFRDEGPRSFFADISWRSLEQGEALADLWAGAEQFRSHLRTRNPRLHFVRFYVWSDCFESYLEARYLAESDGFDVSWMAIDVEDEIGINLLGGPRRQILID